MEMTLAELADLVGGEAVGPLDTAIRGVASPGKGAPGKIVFAENAAALAEALGSGAAAVIVGRDVQAAGKPLLRVDGPREAFIRIIGAVLPEIRPATGVHPSAVLDPSARLGSGVVIAPFVVVEADVEVGDRARIGAGSFVGRGCRIGADSLIHPRVVLYANVEIGERAIVHSGAVIGSDGFGHMMMEGNRTKFPQVGRVVIEDDVEIGANTAIDRAALDATVIRKGAKIDNLVQIAHNVEIGAQSSVSAQTGIAGSSKIGEGVILAGQVGIADHVEIGDRAILGAGAGVPSRKKLAGGQVYWGDVAAPIMEAKRQIGELRRIGKLREKVVQLEKRLAALEGGEK